MIELKQLFVIRASSRYTTDQCLVCSCKISNWFLLFQ